MKKVHFLSAALMALALTACNDDPVGPVSTTDSVTNTEGKYLAIAISNSDASGSRADATTDLPTGDPTYQVGSKAENAINMKYLRFYFFYSDGTPFDMESSSNINTEETVTSNMVTPIALTSIDDDQYVDNQQSKTTNAVLVLGKEAGTYQGGMPSSVICIANTSKEYAGIHRDDLLKEKTLNLTETLIDDKGKEDIYFVMSSSSFWNHTSEQAQFWTDIEPNHITTTPELALKNPVQIYIERVASKVQMPVIPAEKLVKNPDDPENDLVISYLDWDNANNTYTDPISVKIIAKTIGWSLNSINEEVRVIKRVEDYTNNRVVDAAGNSLIGTTRGFFTSNKDWSPMVGESNGVRSFWATTTNEAKPTPFIPNQPTNTVDNNHPLYITPNCKDPFLSYSNAGVALVKGKVNYARSHATKVIVAVEFYLADMDGNILKKDGENVPMKLMKWAGMYYTPEALCHAVAAKTEDPTVPVGYCRSTSVHSTPKGSGHNYQVTFHRAENEDGNYSFNEFGYSFDENNNTNDATQDNQVAIDGTQYWNGMGYYIVNISNQLRATKQGKKQMYGVVRNTIYDYVVENFYGLGTPVPTPDKETEVENPEEGETYVAARLNILNWRLVSNHVTLQ